MNSSRIKQCVLIISRIFLTLFHPGPHLLNPLMKIFPPGLILVLDLKEAHHLLEDGLIPGDKVLQQGDGVPVLVQAEHLVHSGPPEHAEGLQHVRVHPLKPRGLGPRPRVPCLWIQEVVGVEKAALVVDHPE